MSTGSTDGGLASISSTRDIRALAMLPARCARRSSSLAKASKTPKVVGESWRGRLPICQFNAGGKEICHRLLLARLGFEPNEQPTLNRHFFPLDGYQVLQSGPDLTRGAVPQVVAELPSLIPIPPCALLLAASSKRGNQGA